MAILREIMDDICAGAREIEEHNAEHGADMRPVVIPYRAGKQVAIVTSAPQSREEILQLVAVVAFGFAADVIAVVTEAWGSDYPNNPRTGQKWEPKDMERLAEDYRGVERGWVREGVIVTVANRAGDVDMKVMPFRRGHNKVVWLDLPAPVTAEQRSDRMLGGFFLNKLKEVMLRPSLQNRSLELGTTPAALGMTFEAMQAQADAEAIKMLTRRVPVPPGFPEATVAVEVGPPDSERARILKEALPDSTLSD